MSELLTFLPILKLIEADGSQVAHFTVMSRNSRNCERYHLDAPVAEQRSGSKGKMSNTDNRYPIIKSDKIVVNDKLLDHAHDEVDMFRVKINDKGAYMIDIILKPMEVHKEET